MRAHPLQRACAPALASESRRWDGRLCCCSFLGLTPVSILITAALLTLPFLILKDGGRRKIVRDDLKTTSQAMAESVQPDCQNFGYALSLCRVAVILWRVFDRAMIDLPVWLQEFPNNFGDYHST